jgi:hypothetical protein
MHRRISAAHYRTQVVGRRRLAVQQGEGKKAESKKDPKAEGERQTSKDRGQQANTRAVN